MRMSKSNRSILAWFLFVLVVSLSAVSTMAQEAPASKADIFVGYAWADTGSHGFDNLKNMPRGFTAAGTWWGARNFGLTVDSQASFGDNNTRLATLQAGPSVRFPGEHVTLFGHALFGL